MDQRMPYFIGMGVIFTGLIMFAYIVKVVQVRRTSRWLATTGTVTRSKVGKRTKKDMDGRSSVVFDCSFWCLVALHTQALRHEIGL